MHLIARLLEKLRRGTASIDEIENLDRRLFCLGVAASAGALVSRPTVIDLGFGIGNIAAYSPSDGRRVVGNTAQYYERWDQLIPSATLAYAAYRRMNP